MKVLVDQPRQDYSVGKYVVFHVRMIADCSLNMGTTPHRNDAAIFDGYSLGARLC
jgi:hypothetical protein